MTYTEHVQKLLLDVGIPYTFVSPLNSRYVSHPKRHLYIPNIDNLDDVRYAICLHEIGHAHDPITPLQWRFASDRFEAELRAWQWAVTHAIRWTPPMVEMQWAALQSYVEHVPILVVIERGV